MPETIQLGNPVKDFYCTEKWANKMLKYGDISEHND